MIPGTVACNDSGNNKAYVAGDIGLTFNGVSIYYVLKNSPDPQAEGDRRGHQPPESTQGHGEEFADVIRRAERDAVQAQQISERRQGVSALHDGGAAIRPLAVQLPGLLVRVAESLLQDEVLDRGPQAGPYADGLDTSFYDGYAGPISPAATAVLANYTVVDMFASVATGNSTPEAAAKLAARQAARYYKT